MKLCPDPDPRTGACRACGRPCYWTATHARHGARCGVVMRHAKQPCHRLKGHGGDHRTAAAVAYANALYAARYRKVAEGLAA